MCLFVLLFQWPLFWFYIGVSWAQVPLFVRVVIIYISYSLFLVVHVYFLRVQSVPASSLCFVILSVSPLTYLRLSVFSVFCLIVFVIPSLCLGPQSPSCLFCCVLLWVLCFLRSFLFIFSNFLSLFLLYFYVSFWVSSNINNAASFSRPLCFQVLHLGLASACHTAVHDRHRKRFWA